jgi:electron transport complex protein RnfB
VLSGIVLICFLAVGCGLVFGLTGHRPPGEEAADIEAIDGLLPQTQCERCGYPGCRPYATAIALGVADINQCPPGGERTIWALADLLGRDPRPLNPQNGSEGSHTVAVIDEATCIGCTLCIKACPVDAIVGANKQMHTVIASECTGCDLCLPPCPVDCITMVPVPPSIATWTWPRPSNDEHSGHDPTRTSEAHPE